MQPEQHADVLENSNVDLHDTILTQRMEASRECRVLVVDDDDLVRARLSALLRMGHFHVDAAASGEEALRIMSTKRCQILLTDWQMPEMDGLSLCRNVRAAQGEGYVYVLMLTVRDSKQDLLTGLAAGADDYVVKSAPIEEILARMEVARRITHVEHSLRTSNRENRRLSVTDPLTGAHNLRYLMKNLPRELERSLRYGHPLAVLSCDIDQFKQINDRYGHEAGDELLRTFVERAGNCIRKSCDWLARVGGDEFMIVLPETDAAGANRAAQKLRRVFSRCPVLTHAGSIYFTASIGVTGTETDVKGKSASKFEDLLRAADRGLYASKRQGGNRATIAAVSGVKAVSSGTPKGGNRGVN